MKKWNLVQLYQQNISQKLKKTACTQTSKVDVLILPQRSLLRKRLVNLKQMIWRMEKLWFLGVTHKEASAFFRLTKKLVTWSNFGFQTAVTHNNNGSSCWRWPNPDGPELFVHQIVTSVISVTCCSNVGPFQDCCSDNYPQFCECDTITDANAFENCSK